MWIADAPNWNESPGKSHLQYAVANGAIKRRGLRGVRWQLGQMYGVLATGLIFAKFVFKGLQRPMLVDGNGNADQDKFALTWDADRDAKLAGDPFSPTFDYVGAPENSVFVVLASPNTMHDEFPDVDAWIERWAWVDGDPNNKGAPINAIVEEDSRYADCVWRA